MRVILVRNYRVMLGKKVLDHFSFIDETRAAEINPLLIYVVDPVNDKSEIYGPYMHGAEAQRWADNLNGLFRELRREICQ